MSTPEASNGITVLLVAGNGLRKLFRHAVFPVLPRRGDDIEYEDGWGLSSIRYVYLSQVPDIPEIGLDARFTDEELDSLKETGHWHNEVPD